MPSARRAAGSRALVLDRDAAERVVLALRVARPVVRHQDPGQRRVAVEDDPEEVPRLALVPVGGRVDGDDRRDVRVGVGRGRPRAGSGGGASSTAGGRRRAARGRSSMRVVDAGHADSSSKRSAGSSRSVLRPPRRGARGARAASARRGRRRRARPRRRSSGTAARARRRRRRSTRRTAAAWTAGPAAGGRGRRSRRCRRCRSRRTCRSGRRCRTGRRCSRRSSQQPLHL